MPNQPTETDLNDRFAQLCEAFVQCWWAINQLSPQFTLTLEGKTTTRDELANEVETATKITLPAIKDEMEARQRRIETRNAMLLEKDAKINELGVRLDQTVCLMEQNKAIADAELSTKNEEVERLRCNDAKSRESGCWCDEYGHPCKGCEVKQELTEARARIEELEAINRRLTADFG